MTDQQPDDKKSQDVESELTVDDLEDLLESELPYDATDESDLLEDADEPVGETLIKNRDQDESYDLLAESEDFPDLDLPLDELPESVDEELGLEDIEDDLAQMSGWEKQTEKSAMPEISAAPSEETTASVAVPEAVAVPPVLSENISAPEQIPRQQSGIIGVALGVVGVLIAAAAIWLNMGLSDQLSQLKAQQKTLADDAIAQQNKDIRQLEQQVEKLEWLQNHQAGSQQSNLEAMQQQLNDLTTVVANKVAKQWRTGIKTAPVPANAKATPSQRTVQTPPSENKTAPKVGKVKKAPPSSPDKGLQQLVVTSTVGNIRSTASTDGIILYKLRKGTIVGKVSQSGSWIQVRLENGKDAWAHEIIFKSTVDKTKTGPSEASQPNVKKPTKLAGSAKAGRKTGWAVNLVSVESEAVAEKQVAYYQARGIQAEYARVPAKGKIWYRIRVAAFANEKEAIAYKNMLAKKYSISAWHNRM